MKARNMQSYRSRNHSKFIIKYHIIFTCKYRKNLLIKIGDDVKQIMYDISDKNDFEILEMEVDKNHIHFMVSSIPTISPCQIVRCLKQKSTNEIWKMYPGYMKKHFWNENTLWTDGYFVSSIGEVSSETLKKYIQNQG